MCGKCITLGYIGGPELVPRLSPTQNEAEVSIGREKCVSRIRQLSSAVGQKSIGSRLQLEAPDIEVSAELTDLWAEPIVFFFNFFLIIKTTFEGVATELLLTTQTP